MTYSRTSPSPRYRALLDMYGKLHREGEPDLGIDAEATFDGRSLPAHAPKIAQIAREHGAKTLLDYGSGKGRQYKPFRMEFADGSVFDSVQELWNVDAITCYDPGYAEFAQLPSGTFDGVICTDVMEHCPEEDLPWILSEIFGYAKKFVFLSVALYPAVKTMPNGENAHCTLMPTDWWTALFDAAAAGQPDLTYYVCFIDKKTAPDGSAAFGETLFRGRGK